MKTKYLLVPFSYIFHPIFISIYGAFLYFLFTKNLKLTTEVYLSIFQIFILTILLPICFYTLLKTLKVVKSFTEATIEERKYPIFIQILLLYCLLNFTILDIHFPELYKFFQAGLLSSFLAFILVLLRFKASLHMIGCTSLFTFIMMLTSYLEIEATYTLAYLIMCMGFVASSRLYMKAHTPFELIIGILIGGVPQVLLWFYSI